MKMDEMLSTLLRGEDGSTTSFGGHEWFPSVRIETTLSIGRGRCIVDEGETAAEHEIYKVKT
jgi:hypothetical protein